MDLATQGVDVMTPQLLPGLHQRPPELGRIRMGEKTERGLPVRLKTFRLTSHSKGYLDAAAGLYGGQVREWKDAPDEGMWELVTAASELDILIPASLAVIGQSYELWQGGTCERRCDGITEAISASPCICAAQGLDGAGRPCDIITRLRVMLPRIPGLGVWRLDTGGYVAATTLPSTVRLLAQLTPGAWIPAVLRAEQRSKKERDDKGKVVTHRFVVPALDLPGTTIASVIGSGKAQDDTALLEDGESPKAPTAADKVAARRAALEAQAGGGQQDGHASAADPAIPTPAPTLPLPKGQCNVASPKGEDCRLPLGHDGDHQAANKRWPTPQQAAGGASSHAAPERAPAGDGEAHQDEGAGSVAPAPAPAVSAVEAALQVFEGEFVEVGDRPADPQPERTGLVECGSKSPLTEGEICGMASGHQGVHRSRVETWT